MKQFMNSKVMMNVFTGFNLLIGKGVGIVAVLIPRELRLSLISLQKAQKMGQDEYCT